MGHAGNIRTIGIVDLAIGLADGGSILCHSNAYDQRHSTNCKCSRTAVASMDRRELIDGSLIQYRTRRANAARSAGNHLF